MTTFAKVVEAGGFAAAARRLGMSRSMATAHVQSLEDRLGVRLLNRSTRKISLTEVGRTYYERCLQILAEMDDADRAAQVLQSTPRGTLRLNASVAIPPLLAPVIAEFTELYPDVAVSMTMSDRMIDLVDEGYDLAIRISPIADSSLVARKIATYRLLVCGSPDYFARHGIPKTPADLADHNCLIYSNSPWGDEWRLSGADGDQPVGVVGNLHTNSINALRLAAVQGQGLVMMPSFLLAEELRTRALVPTLVDFTRKDYPINAIYPHRKHVSAKVRGFLDLVAQHYSQNPAWSDPCRMLQAGRKALLPDAVNTEALPSAPVDGMAAEEQPYA